jgi:hypothetical protein
MSVCVCDHVAGWRVTRLYLYASISRLSGKRNYAIVSFAANAVRFVTGYREIGISVFLYRRGVQRRKCGMCSIQTCRLFILSLNRVAHLWQNVDKESWSTFSLGYVYPGGTLRRHLRMYAETSYIHQNETQEPLEPSLILALTKIHALIDLLATSSVISLTRQNNINNWKII